MKKQLLYFNHLYSQIKKNFICEESEDNSKDTDIQIQIDASATIDGEKAPVTVNVKQDVNIDNINIDKVDININIKNLKIKLEKQLEQTKKKAYASRLYSTKVGNNPDALRDYGYFLGQKNILTSILKDLNNLCIEIDNDIQTDQENDEK